MQGSHVGKFALAEVHVARSSDMGVSDKFFVVRTHMGNILNPGDTVLGYDLTTSNINENEIGSLKGMIIPDLVLVKKTYDKKGKNSKRRWALKMLDKEKTESYKKRDETKEMQDYEDFAQELEEDPDMRKNVNIYRAREADSVSMVNDDDDALIPVDELLGGLTLDARVVRLNPEAAIAAIANDVSDTVSDTVSIINEDDFPDFDEQTAVPSKIGLAATRSISKKR